MLRYSFFCFLFPFFKKKNNQLIFGGYTFEEAETPRVELLSHPGKLILIKQRAKRNGQKSTLPVLELLIQPFFIGLPDLSLQAIKFANKIYVNKLELLILEQ